MYFVFFIWKIPKKKQKYYSSLSTPQITKPVPTISTDSESLTEEEKIQAMFAQSNEVWNQTQEKMAS